MKTAIFTKPKQIQIQEVELPPLKADQALVEVKAVGLCTWEQRFYRGDPSASYPFRGGHEVAGRVVEVGPEANIEARPGDTVCLALKNRCGNCYYCHRGLDNLCLNPPGGNWPDGSWGPAGLSQYVIAEADQVYKANAALPFEQLALAEPVACVFRSVSLPPLQPGDLVIVQGVGIMGLIHTQLLRQMGMRVVVTEPDEGRRQAALNSGANFVLDPFAVDLADFVREQNSGVGAQAVFFTAGGGPAIRQGMEALAGGGWLCLYGSIHPKGPIEIDPNEIHYRELFFSGTFSHTRHSFRQAVRAISHQLVDLSGYISDRVPFEEVQRGFELAIRPDTYRVIVLFP